MWIQKITTKEPTLDMLEVAIVSTKCALRDEFPEFMEFWQARGWEPKVESIDEPTEESENREGAPEADEAAPAVNEEPAPATESAEVGE